MKQPTLLFTLLLSLAGCTDSATPSDAGVLPDAPTSLEDVGSMLDGSMPDGAPDGSVEPDAGQDAGPPPSCEPSPAGSCEVTETQWFWSVGDCSPRADCPSTGYATLGECRLAYAHCEGPDLCAGPPSFVQECVGEAEGGYAWSGEECVPGCDYFTPDVTIYSTLGECLHFHQPCGAEGECGPVLTLGCTTVMPTFEPFSEANNDGECAGAEGWDAQVVFVAPDDGEYQVRVRTEGGESPVGTRMAITRGVCSTRAADLPAAAACVGYDEFMTIPARASTGADSVSRRAHTIRISPMADPDMYTSLVVCVARTPE